MRTFEIQLFGALREFEPDALLRIGSDATDVHGLRAAVQAHADAAWTASAAALLRRSAFASATTVLREGDALPEGERLALLPPVSGG